MIYAEKNKKLHLQVAIPERMEDFPSLPSPHRRQPGHPMLQAAGDDFNALHSRYALKGVLSPEISSSIVFLRVLHCVLSESLQSGQVLVVICGYADQLQRWPETG